MKPDTSPNTPAILPAYVQERAKALGIGEGGEPRRLVRTVSEMSAGELEAIGNTEMDARHGYLDGELEGERGVTFLALGVS